jgi:hypothetical protein
VLSFEPDFIL